MSGDQIHDYRLIGILGPFPLTFQGDLTKIMSQMEMVFLFSPPFPFSIKSMEPMCLRFIDRPPGCWLDNRTQELNSEDKLWSFLNSEPQEMDGLATLAVPFQHAVLTPLRIYSSSLQPEWPPLHRKGMETKTLSSVQMADGGGGNAWTVLTTFLLGENSWGMWGS